MFSFQSNEFFFSLKKKNLIQLFSKSLFPTIFFFFFLFFILKKKKIMVFQTLFLSNNLPPIGSFPFPIDHFSFISNRFFFFQKINSILCTKYKLTESHKLGICFNRTKKKNFLSLFLVRRAPTQYNHSLSVLFFPLNNKPYVCWFSKGFPLLFLIKETKELFQQ